MSLGSTGLWRTTPTHIALHLMSIQNLAPYFSANPLVVSTHHELQKNKTAVFEKLAGEKILL